MKMNRRTLLATGASAATLATLGLPVRAQEPLKIGFIYVGPIGDGGWTYQHDQGRLAVEEHFGDAGRDDLPGVGARGRGRRAGHHPDGAVGLRADLHDLVRLHGRDR
jgi:hypothetical protein